MYKKVVVIGASEKPQRMSNKVVKLLVNKGFEVVALGNKAGRIDAVSIHMEKEMYADVDTVTLYLKAQRQQEYYDYIISLKPRRVLFNPGAENREFEKVLKDNGIAHERVCTMVLLKCGLF